MDDDRYQGFRWLERGEGEPVVLLHGLMGQMGHWDAALDALAGACRPLALHLPIFDRVLRAPRIEEVAAYAADFLDALDIPQAVVGGNSLGGHVALALALARPERVSGLVLTGSSRLFERSFTRSVPHRPTAEYVRQKMEEVFYSPALVTPEWVESVRRLVTAPAPALAVLRFARAAKRCNLEDRLSAIHVPALLVCGRDDRITPPDVAERFRAGLPEAELVLLPRCGHAPMLEQPAAFAAAVEDWLVATRARRGPRAVVSGGRR